MVNNVEVIKRFKCSTVVGRYWSAQIIAFMLGKGLYLLKYKFSLKEIYVH